LQQLPPLPNPRVEIEIGGLVAARAAANHPYRHHATLLKAEVGSAVAVGVIGGSPRGYITPQLWKKIAAEVAANHLRHRRTHHLGAEAGIAAVARVISGNPRR
jgi:hypothetical protein